MRGRDTRWVVLGGGGVSGIAWELGIIAGMARAGVDLREADGFVGTSAGAVVGAQLAHGADIESLLAKQLDPTAASGELYRPYSQAHSDALNRVLMEKVGGDLSAARRRIGAYAMRAETPSLEMRRAIVAARLQFHDWPPRALRLVAVDTASGAARLFEAADGLPLVDAVAASCAVPGTWPAVPIQGAHYMDGGVHSITNAQAAHGADCVVILAPFGYSDGNPVAGHLRAEIQALQETGCRVHVVVPNEDAAAAIGDNVLDPSLRAAAAEAGLAMADKAAARIRPDWTD